MIRHEAAQGSREWLNARIGIPTASQFHRIVTPSKLAKSSAWKKYLHELLADWAFGETEEAYESAWMRRGTEMEPTARDWYAFEHFADPEPVGLCLLDDRTAGASPDALVGDDGLLEIKCPAPHTHIGYLLDGPGDSYRMQMQGQMWVTNRLWCDFLSYNPTLPKVCVRVERDPDAMAALDKYVREFCAQLAMAKVKLRALGVVPALEKPPMSFAEAAGIKEASMDDIDKVLDSMRGMNT